MLLNRVSMRVSLIVTLIAMGGLSVMFSLASSGYYRELALTHEHDSLVKLTQIRVSEMRKVLEADAVRYVASQQTQGPLLAAIAERNVKAVTAYLNGFLQQVSVTSLEEKPTSIHAYDADMNLIAAVPPLGSAQPICKNMIELASRRQGVARQNIFAGLCVADNNLYHTTLVPLGEKKFDGYLLTTVDILPKLTAMEKTYGMPTRLAFSDGRLLYRSANWPATDDDSMGLVTDYALHVHSTTKTFLRLSFFKDIRGFNEGLANTQYFLFLGAVAATLIFILIALLLLQVTTINPLRKLTTLLRRVREDEGNLGQRIMVGGNVEIAELASGFNEMTTKLKQLYQDLEHMAFTDALTKLPNRALFMDRLQQAVLTSHRDHKPFALLIMDLDNFKYINDTLGHQAGDQLLQQVAERLRSKLRKSDTIARLGGDEFAMLLPTVDAKHADMAARMLLQSLRAPFVLQGQSFDIGASIGITLYPDHGVEATILLQRADVSMYAAKRSNSGHEFYDNELDRNYPNRLQLLGELRHAIDEEQFELYYQPKINLHTNRLCGVEALVRWQHPDGRLLLPKDFIPLMEQNGLIKSLTVWVLNEALQKSKTLCAMGRQIPISINLSVRDLLDSHLTETITEILAANQAEPDRLEIEITESAVMTDPERSLGVLAQLSEMGLKLTVDDFGTGYSSLSYLKKLPVQTVKIDQSFIMDMAEDDSDAAIVRTSIELAHNLGLQVIAEGVNSEEILECLKHLGCDAAQGAYISRALSENELNEWIMKSTWSRGMRKGAARNQGSAVH